MMSDRRITVRLNPTNEKRFEEIKKQLVENEVLNKNSTNEIMNFIIKNFYQLFVLNVENKYSKQINLYLKAKQNSNSNKNISNEILKRKMDFVEDDIETMMYILMNINRSINAIDYDPNGVFDSVIDADNPFSNLIKQSRNSVYRDKKKLHVKKYHDE